MMLTVDAPLPCSDECTLDAPVIEVFCDDAGTPSDPGDDTFTYTILVTSAVCDDNGTPSDPSDDTFDFTINVSGSNTGATYSISGDFVANNLAYGVDFTFGPFNIADGDLVLTITDSDDANCQTIGVVTAPPTCSDECELNDPIIAVQCDDNGTPTDPTDDTFTYTIEVTGQNVGTTYNITGDDSQTGCCTEYRMVHSVHLTLSMVIWLLLS
jgi:uncharacterized lipoprotein YehR (DUF1307 family)